LFKYIFSATENKNIVVSEDGFNKYEVGSKLKVKIKEKIYVAKVSVVFH